MRILVVSPNLPYPAWGASARNYYLLKALARKHSISLLALINTEVEAYGDLRLLTDLVDTVQTIPLRITHAKRWRQLMSVAHGKSYLLHLHMLPAMQEALDSMLARNHYDVVLFESAFVAGYRLSTDAKIIIDQHNIEHELLQRTYELEKAPLRRWYSWRESRLIKPIEIELCRKADIVLVTSEREQRVLKDILPENFIEVVSNGVDIQTFSGNVLVQEVPNQIIYTGTMDYYPNISAVLFFAQYCWPLIREQLPDATWHIVGRNPSPEVRRLAQLPGISVTGTVPDIRPYLAASPVAIAPLRFGGGTRLKILEALSMRKAVVSTSVGSEGLSVIPGKHLIIADEPEAFSQAVVALLKNPLMRTTFGTAGRALVEAEYSWERCGERLLDILEEKVLVC